MRDSPQILFFGDNRDGQLGLGNGNGEDSVNLPTPLRIEAAAVQSVVVNQKQSYILLQDGSTLNCGANDNNELARSGKRSVFQRVDAVEAFSIVDVALGDNITLLLTKDGKIVSWGMNAFGQLGCGDREFREKPKMNPPLGGSDSILQLAAGKEHVLALSKGGNVLTWGANRKGQLGDGQLTSCFSPRLIPQLRHRPVIAISCGEAHSMVLTIGGSVYSWGDNTNGALGTGDTTNRLRPELLRSLRAARARQICAGRQHSMVVSSGGLLFAFGLNSHGQLGLGSADIRLQPHPTVVERLRELRTEKVACGSAHTLVLCTVPADGSSPKRTKVFSMGLNSSGQLGLGHNNTVFTATSIPLVASDGTILTPIGVASHALAFHSIIITKGVPLARPKLPSVDLMSLSLSVQRVKEATSLGNADALAIRNLREIIAAAFSSISVLNASFRTTVDHSSTILEGALTIDLAAVRTSYHLLFSTENEQIVSTLGRATLQLADHLKECPFDDPENLSVFLIVLENPLMLRPASFHVAIERVVTGILALPRSFRLVLFGWLRNYTSEYFSRALQVLQGYLSFALTSKITRIDPTPAVLVLNSLYECNRLARIVPDKLMYNGALESSVNLYSEWLKFKEAGVDSLVFNFYSYPFLIDITTKSTILHGEFKEQMHAQSYSHLSKYLYTRGMGSDVATMSVIQLTMLSDHMPKGVKITRNEDSGRLHAHFDVSISRENLLYDLLEAVDSAMSADPLSLKLPLKVHFRGEEAIDQGGVTKELFTLAVKQLIKDSGIIRPCANHLFVWFSTDVERIIHSKFFEKTLLASASGYQSRYPCLFKSQPSAVTDSRASISNNDGSKIPRRELKDSNVHLVTCLANTLGLLVGLASFHGVLVELPLPPAIYKIMSNTELILEDVYAVDSHLAKGLRYLLDFEDGQIEQLLCTTFTASLNPLLDGEVSAEAPHTDGMSDTTRSVAYVDLKENGSEIYVNRGNRSEFVNLFIQHTLCGCCRELVAAYLNGIRVLFSGPLIQLCSHEEIEVLLSGTRDIGDLSELRLNTLYRGEFHDEHPIVQWFWDILSEMQDFEKHHFLHFVSGSDRIPVGGITKLGLLIQSIQQSPNSLPSSHTCFNILNIPNSYENKEMLREKMRIAISHFEGFGFA